MDFSKKIGIDGKTLGRRVRDKRNELNLSQQDLADRVGVNRGTIIRIENGQTWPQPHTMEKLCMNLDMSMSGLLNGHFNHLPPLESTPVVEVHTPEESVSENFEILYLREQLLDLKAKLAGLTDHEKPGNFFEYVAFKAYEHLKGSTLTSEKIAELVGLDHEQLAQEWRESKKSPQEPL